MIYTTEDKRTKKAKVLKKASIYGNEHKAGDSVTVDERTLANLKRKGVLE